MNNQFMIFSRDFLRILYFLRGLKSLLNKHLITIQTGCSGISAALKGERSSKLLYPKRVPETSERKIRRPPLPPKNSVVRNKVHIHM